METYIFWIENTVSGMGEGYNCGFRTAIGFLKNFQWGFPAKLYDSGNCLLAYYNPATSPRIQLTTLGRESAIISGMELD